MNYFSVSKRAAKLYQIFNLTSFFLKKIYFFLVTQINN